MIYQIGTNSWRRPRRPSLRPRNPLSRALFFSPSCSAHRLAVRRLLDLSRPRHSSSLTHWQPSIVRPSLASRRPLSSEKTKRSVMYRTHRIGSWKNDVLELHLESKILSKKAEVAQCLRQRVGNVTHSFVWISPDPAAVSQWPGICLAFQQLRNSQTSSPSKWHQMWKHQSLNLAARANTLSVQGTIISPSRDLWEIILRWSLLAPRSRPCWRASYELVLWPWPNSMVSSRMTHSNGRWQNSRLSMLRPRSRRILAIGKMSLARFSSAIVIFCNSKWPQYWARQVSRYLYNSL